MLHSSLLQRGPPPYGRCASSRISTTPLPGSVTHPPTRVQVLHGTQQLGGKVHDDALGRRGLHRAVIDGGTRVCQPFNCLLSSSQHAARYKGSHRASAAHAPQTELPTSPPCLALGKVRIQQVLQAAVCAQRCHQHAAALAQQQGGGVDKPLPHCLVGRQAPHQRLADVPAEG